MVQLRTFLSRYILSLALADLLLIITCVPFTSIIYTVESWPWGIVVCKISYIVGDISIGVSVFTLTALSAERYCAIVNPLKRFQVGTESTLIQSQFRCCYIISYGVKYVEMKTIFTLNSNEFDKFVTRCVLVGTCPRYILIYKWTYFKYLWEEISLEFLVS